MEHDNVQLYRLLFKNLPFIIGNIIYIYIYVSIYIGI